MDQTTQVNFPLSSKYVRKRLQRQKATIDLHVSPLHRQTSTSSTTLVIPQFKVTPPKSDDSLTSEMTLSMISHDKPLPYTSSSFDGSYSRHGNNNKHFLQVPPLPYMIDIPHSTSRSNSPCKCFVANDNVRSRTPTSTAEGLSWRRLHMSRAKLKATSTTSELLSGFAMVAMVELQINEDTTVPEWLFVMFSVCTTVLVAVHIFALMISTYILPNIDAISKLDVCELVSESPHERMKGFIELAWAFSTILGLFLFLVEVAILCWVKFWDYSFTAAIAATVIVIPVLVIFVLFAVHFYHSLVVYRYDTSISDMQKLEDMKKHLDEVSSPV